MPPTSPKSHNSAPPQIETSAITACPISIPVCRPPVAPRSPSFPHQAPIPIPQCKLHPIPKKSEVGGRMSEVRCQKSDLRCLAARHESSPNPPGLPNLYYMYRDNRLSPPSPVVKASIRGNPLCQPARPLVATRGATRGAPWIDPAPRLGVASGRVGLESGSLNCLGEGARERTPPRCPQASVAFGLFAASPRGDWSFPRLPEAVGKRIVGSAASRGDTRFIRSRIGS